MNLQEYKTYFDEYLETRLEQKLAEVRPLFPDEQTFSLVTYLRPYVDHGKRFRPYMVYLWYSLYGGKDIEYITQVGLIHELIHVFALIHDDICDQGTMRHGIPAYHQKLAEQYENPFYGDVQAMLVGDLVYSRALQQAQQHLSGTFAHTLIFDMLNEVIIGQMLDVEYSVSSDATKSADVIANKDHLKSGQYSFQKPMMVGASLAGVEDLEKIERMGKKIGIAFQMRDDLLDWIPNKEGKTKMSDIQEGNQTVVMTTCREIYDEKSRATLRSKKGKKASEEELAMLQSDFKKYNIESLVLEKVSLLLDEVSYEYKLFDIEEGRRQDFDAIIELLRNVG